MIEQQVNPFAAGAGGIRRRSFIAGGGAAITTLGVITIGGSTAVATAGAPARYQALPPLRLCDTRPGPYRNFGFTRTGNVTRVAIAGRTVGSVTVPADATAAVFTLVGIHRGGGRNYLSAFPAGTAWPGTSSVNMPFPDAVEANLVTVQFGGGAVDVLADQPADVILDLAGVYIPAASARSTDGRYQEIGARRVIDTRNQAGKPASGSTVHVDLTSLQASAGLADDAQAVSVNLTAAAPSANGYLTAYPFGQAVPATSSLNVRVGENRAVGANVTLGRDAAGRVGFDVFVQAGAHVIVDVTGFFTGPSASESSTGLFVPVTPERIMDTRKGQRDRKRLWPGWTRAFDIPVAYRADVGSAVLNLTATRTMGKGFFSVNGAQTRTGTPTTSNLNVSGPNQVIANHVVSQVSDLGLEVFSEQGGDVIADLVGYYTGPRSTPTRPVPVDPPPPAIAPPYWMVAPSIARMNAGRAVVASGDPKATVDAGNIWHWSGTGLVGNGSSNVATFGHRTEGGGPFYFLDGLGDGSRVFVSTGDQRSYVYKFLRREVTSKNNMQILAATRRSPGESLSMIACTVGFDRSKSRYPDAWAPTSLEYRIVVTLAYEYWTDDIALM